jgi:phosphoserine aminotransferase
MRLHNFCAGPGRLPDEVLEEARDEMMCLPGSGASILEMSHRSSVYGEIERRAADGILRLLGITSGWSVLFLQGGASQQFLQVPMNLMGERGAGYLLSGVWAEKAWVEAQRFGDARVVGSTRDEEYVRVPTVTEDVSELSYVHYCLNNTIYGTRYAERPRAEGVRWVCDASSEFLSRPMDLSEHVLVYAGAQKNVGPAGVTVVLVADEVCGERNEAVPALWDYAVHRQGLYNTPPVFSVYMVGKVVAWIEREGGLEEMERRAERRAAEVYGVLDGSEFWVTRVWKESRSRMNVCFRLRDERLEEAFVREGRAEGLLEMKGHRATGGLRVSLYNACPMASVEALTGFMRQFEARWG